MPLIARAHWMLPPLVVALLMAPMIFTSRAYASDWSNNLWFVWEQGLNIRTLGHPSYFVQSGIGAFFPNFLFYGGTLYSVAGFATIVLGEHPLAVYVATYFLAMVGAYAGWLWLCTQLSLSGWRAHVPAILFVTSAYYVTNIYGRGDMGEVVATSMIPLGIACGVNLIKARRLHVAPLALFVTAVIFFTGSHPLTLVWGTTLLALPVIALLLTRWRQARALWRRIGTIATAAALGAGINAWTLLPTLIYHDRTFHGTESGISQLSYSAPSVLFSVLRNTVNPTWITGDVQTQAPVLAIAWALVAGVASWRLASGSNRRYLTGLTALLIFLSWLILSPGVLGSLPKPWENIQFPFRLVTYVTLTACGLVTCALIALRSTFLRVRRVADVALIVVSAMSVVLATIQVWQAPSFYFKHRTEVFASAVNPPQSYYSGLDFADNSAPVVQPSITQLQGGTPLANRASIELPSSPFKASYSYPIIVPLAGTVATNVATGPYLVTVAGAKPVGRTSNGFMVVQLSGTPGEHEVLTFSTSSSPALRFGLLGTFAASAGVLLLLAVVFVRGRRCTRRGSGSAGQPQAN
jgi:hypothetical protein